MIIKYIIYGYLNWMWYYIYKPYRDKQKKLFDERLHMCESCENFRKLTRTCSICGCFMDVKTRGMYGMHNNLAVFKNSKEIIYVCDAKKW